MPRTRPRHPSVSRSLRLPLDRLVADISAALDDDQPDTLLRIAGDPPQVGYLPLGGQHPLDTLLGFTAPCDWVALGVHCHGRAHPLDGGPDAGATPVVITTLIDRSGRGAGVLRRLAAGDVTSPAPIPGDIAGDVPEATAVTRYDRAPDGTVGDACRRALGLPTPPPPPSTADLWLRLWLEQVVEASAPPGSDARSATWARIAELHPAARRPGLTGDADRSLRLDDPYALAETTLALADRWTWPRLRREPEIVALAGPMVCRQVARWMDDGMFARALLAELPSLAQATLSTSAVLPDAVQQQIDVAIVATGLRWSGGDDTGPEVADQ